MIKLSDKDEKLIIVLLTILQFVHILDFVILMPLGPMLMRELKIIPSEFGTLVSSYTFASALFGLFCGVFMDKIPRKTFLNLSFIGFILGTFWCGFSYSFYQLLTARILTGIFGGVLTSAVYAMVADLIPMERRGKAMGTIMGAFSIASIVGIPLGLYIASKFGWQQTFIFIAFASVIILILCQKFIPYYLPAIQKKSSLGQQLLEYYQTCSDSRNLKGLLLIFTLAMSAFTIIPFIGAYLVSNLGFQENQLQYVYLFGGLLTIFSSRMIGILCDKIGSFKIFITCALLSFIPIIILTNMPKTEIYIILIVTTLFMSLVSGRFVPALTLTTSLPKPTQRGAYMTLNNAVRSLGVGFASLIAGKIIIFNEAKELIHYDLAGYLSIGFTILSFYFAYQVQFSGGPNQNKVIEIKATT